MSVDRDEKRDAAEQTSHGDALLVVLSGPSGAGKDSVRDLLMVSGLPMHFVVTATDRAPRPGERPGVHYHFMTTAEFEALEAQGAFIESAVVYGQHKGVPRSEIEGPLGEGRDVFARVDLQGAHTLRRLYPDALLIFLAPPSLDEARRRLDERDTEGDEEADLRAEVAVEEMEAAASFDHVVVNRTGELTSTALKVLELIAEAKARRAPPPGS